MAFAAWEIGVFLNAKSNAARVFTQTATAARGAATQTTAATAAVNKQAAAVSRLGVVAKAAAVGYAALGVGLAAAMVGGVKGAGDLQVALTTLQNTFPRISAAQKEMLRQTAFNISSVTAQSVADSANVMAVMAKASGGIWTPEQLAAVAMPAAKFADVQFLQSKGRISFEEAARWGIILAHQFQKYDPKGVTDMLTMATRLSMTMPDNLNKAVTQMSYYMPLFKALHVPDVQSVGMMAMVSRQLGGRRGGTWLADFVLESLSPLQITKHFQAGQGKLLTQMGITDAGGRNLWMKHGQYDVLGMLYHLSEWAKDQKPGYAVQAFESAFKKQGGRFAMAAATPQFLSVMQKTMYFLTHGGSLDSYQARYMANLPGRFQQFVTNFRSVFIELAWPWMDTLSNTFHFLADSLHNFQVWLHQHPFAEKALGVGATGVAATGTLLGALMMGGMGLSGFGMAGGMIGRSMAFLGGAARFMGLGGLVTAFTGIRLAALPLLGPVGTLALVGIALWALAFHNREIAHWIRGSAIPAITSAWQAFTSAFMALIQSWANQVHKKLFGTYFQDPKHPNRGTVGNMAQQWQHMWNLPAGTAKNAAINAIFERVLGPGWATSGKGGPGYMLTPAQRDKLLREDDPHTTTPFGRSVLYGDPGAIHIGNVNVNLSVDPKGSPADLAKAVGRAIAGLRTYGRTSGTRSPGTPSFNTNEFLGVSPSIATPR